MRFDDLKYKLKEFWLEFKKSYTGLFGLGILVFLLVAVLLEKQITPFPDGSKNWANINYWQDLPAGAKPTWTNLFTSNKLPKSEELTHGEFIKSGNDRLTKYTTEFKYDFDYSQAPNDIILYFDTKGRLMVNVSIIRPDGKEVKLERKSYNTEEFTRNRYSVDIESLNGAYKFASKEDYAGTSKIQKNIINSTKILFSSIKENMIQDVKLEKGTYTIVVEALVPGNKGEIKEAKGKVVGKVFGLMGTDLSKRDVFTGLIAGVKWAMLIGLLIAFLSTVIGVTYGITSAYFGGFVDAAMQRIAEFLMNIPFIPVMIGLAAIFKPSIWIFIILMCALRWVSSVRTVRSMGMQIKNETYIEASKALGASHSRLIFKHMIPIMIPFSFSQMALAVPGAILAESTLSILGLGDPSIVTWGQMLNDAKVAGAVIQGLWWWIVTPGLMISLVGMSFAFVGFAMDKILNPKLKTR